MVHFYMHDYMYPRVRDDIAAYLGSPRHSRVPRECATRSLGSVRLSIV